jgi:hypothetical protein
LPGLWADPLGDTLPSIADGAARARLFGRSGALAAQPKGVTCYGWALNGWINRRRPVQIVAYALVGIYPGWVAGLFEALAPPSALPALTKMPCRWHCERQWQGDGIHRHAAGNVLHSLVPSLPIGPPPFFISDRKLKICLIFVAMQGDLLPAVRLNAKRYMYK